MKVTKLLLVLLCWFNVCMANVISQTRTIKVSPDESPHEVFFQLSDHMEFKLESLIRQTAVISPPDKFGWSPGSTSGDINLVDCDSAESQTFIFLTSSNYKLPGDAFATSIIGSVGSCGEGNSSGDSTFEYALSSGYFAILPVIGTINTQNTIALTAYEFFENNAGYETGGPENYPTAATWDVSPSLSAHFFDENGEELSIPTTEEHESITFKGDYELDYQISAVSSKYSTYDSATSIVTVTNGLTVSVVYVTKNDHKIDITNAGSVNFSNLKKYPDGSISGAKAEVVCSDVVINNGIVTAVEIEYTLKLNPDILSYPYNSPSGVEVYITRHYRRDGDVSTNSLSKIIYLPDDNDKKSLGQVLAHESGHIKYYCFKTYKDDVIDLVKNYINNELPSSFTEEGIKNTLYIRIKTMGSQDHGEGIGRLGDEQGENWLNNNGWELIDSAPIPYGSEVDHWRKR